MTAGIEVTTPEGVMTAHAPLLLVCVDLSAKAKLLNMKQYNRAYGCHVCEDEGVSCCTARDWPCVSPRRLRSLQTVVTNACEATRSGKAVKT